MGSAGPNHRYSDDRLLVAIRQVGEGIEDPEKLTQREFDALREAKGVTCPRAAAICARFGVSWTRIKEASFGDVGGSFRHFRRTTAGNGVFPADREACISAVRLAARQISSDTLLPRQYEKQRELALRGRRGDGRLQVEGRWPPVSQIAGFGWDQIVSEAGLAIRPAPELAKSMEVIDVMELFLEARGFVPNRRTIREFANGYGISMAKDEGKASTYLEALRERRIQSGLWTPPAILRGPRYPLMPAEVIRVEKRRTSEFAAAYPLVGKGSWTEERILEGLDLAISKLGPSESLTQKKLRQLAKENPGKIPTASTVTKYAKEHGTTLAELREQAFRRVDRW
jgi:hypothetical protein